MERKLFMVCINEGSRLSSSLWVAKDCEDVTYMFLKAKKQGLVGNSVSMIGIIPIEDSDMDKLTQSVYNEALKHNMYILVNERILCVRPDISLTNVSHLIHKCRLIVDYNIDNVDKIYNTCNVFQYTTFNHDELRESFKNMLEMYDRIPRDDSRFVFVVDGSDCSISDVELMVSELDRRSIIILAKVEELYYVISQNETGVIMYYDEVLNK